MFIEDLEGNVETRPFQPTDCEGPLVKSITLDVFDVKRLGEMVRLYPSGCRMVSQLADRIKLENGAGS